MADPKLPTEIDVTKLEQPTTFSPWREVNESIAAAASPPNLLDARTNEDDAMRKKYPGEYVAYRDVWASPVFRREVLAHDRSLKAVHATLSHLSERELNLVRVTYCDDPAESAAFRGGFDNHLLLKPNPPLPVE